MDSRLRGNDKVIAANVHSPAPFGLRGARGLAGALAVSLLTLVAALFAACPAPVEVAGLKRRLEHLLACLRRDTNQVRPPKDRKQDEDRIEPW